MACKSSHISSVVLGFTIDAYMICRFRWVVCQVDRLRRTFPASIRSVLDDLPKTLDETYGRILLGITRRNVNMPSDSFDVSWCLFVLFVLKN